MEIFFVKCNNFEGWDDYHEWIYGPFTTEEKDGNYLIKNIDGKLIDDTDAWTGHIHRATCDMEYTHTTFFREHSLMHR